MKKKTEALELLRDVFTSQESKHTKLKLLGDANPNYSTTTHEGAKRNNNMD